MQVLKTSSDFLNAEMPTRSKQEQIANDVAETAMRLYKVLGGSVQRERLSEEAPTDHAEGDATVPILQE